MKREIMKKDDEITDVLKTELEYLKDKLAWEMVKDYEKILCRKGYGLNTYKLQRKLIGKARAEVKVTLKYLKMI